MTWTTYALFLLFRTRENPIRNYEADVYIINARYIAAVNFWLIKWKALCIPLQDFIFIPHSAEDSFIYERSLNIRYIHITNLKSEYKHSFALVRNKHRSRFRSYAAAAPPTIKYIYTRNYSSTPRWLNIYNPLVEYILCQIFSGCTKPQVVTLIA